MELKAELRNTGLSVKCRPDFLFFESGCFVLLKNLKWFYGQKF